MNRRYRFGPGAALLTLLAVVLAMSALGALTLMRALDEAALSERAAEVAESFTGWTFRPSGRSPRSTPRSRLPRRTKARRRTVRLWPRRCPRAWRSRTASFAGRSARTTGARLSARRRSRPREKRRARFGANTA